MERIRKLDAQLANQIAAGEVVERPASVVKELIENALDAEATRVDVEVDEAGQKRITVHDDGVGMSATDARMALERHATSKIAAIGDLNDLSTFGFRGEALPSIASVSRFRLTTREEGAESATTVRTHAGSPLDVTPDGAPRGTTIEVCDLFEGVPARRKFLKSAITENTHIAEAVFYAALARPDVTFTLTRDGKRVREYLRANSLSERVAQALPHEKLTAFSFDRGPVRVQAFLGDPERASRGPVGLHILVNARPIRDRAVAKAVAHAYGSRLEPGRYPVGVVYLSIPSAHVDVNVHPQKAEVRFQDPRALFDAISRGLGAELARTDAQGPALARTETFFQAKASESSFLPPRYAEANRGDAPLVVHEPSRAGPEDTNLFRAVKLYGNLSFAAHLRKAYLACEGKDALYILDMHATAERVMLHELTTARKRGSIASRAVAEHEPVMLREEQASFLERGSSRFSALGLEFGRSGPKSATLVGVPDAVSVNDARTFVQAFATEGLLESQSNADTLRFEAWCLSFLACHGAPKRGDSVNPDEVARWLSVLDEVDFSVRTPHGKPLLKRIAFDDFEFHLAR